MLQKISSIYHTVKYLKPSQIKYQVWYRLKAHFIQLANYKDYQNSPLHPVNSGFTRDLILSSNKYLGNLSFSFLNLDHEFNHEVDWNFMGYGKLWNYNLQYFDYLFDDAISHDDKQKLLENFSACLLNGTVKPEPYPVSLRIINWILYFSETGYCSPDFEKALKYQINYLEHNLEFHIQANHLLENYFSLFISGIALNEPKLINSSWLAILKQLDEQILDDGAHYECSPMYHSIILAKLILLFDINEKNLLLQDINRCKEKIRSMLGWLKMISFSNQTWPFLNDATIDIAPDVSAISRIAGKLKLEVNETILKESGYRKFRMGNCEVLVDVGNIGPSYQPGHSHSDMLSVYLQVNNKPILVDAGTSTYENNEQRKIERSTLSHNTVVLNGNNQSDVWGSFRVGARAKITIYDDSHSFVSASHDGYKKKFGKEHFRSFSISPQSLIIKDRLSGNSNNHLDIAALFHFDQSCSVQYDNTAGAILVNNNLRFVFEGYQKIEISNYQQAVGFNRLVKSNCVKVYFKDLLTTSILCL